MSPLAPSLLRGASLLIMFAYMPWFVSAQTLAASGTASAPASVSPSAARPTAANPVPSAAASASATRAYTGTPYLAFQPIATQTACGLTHIFFNLYGEDASKVNITLYALNEGIDQTIPTASPRPSSVPSATASARTQVAVSSRPSLSSSSIVQRSATPSAISSARPTSAVAVRPTTSAPVGRTLIGRTELNINSTLTTQPANRGWDFNPLKLPEGRYYILGVINDDYQTTNRSNIFTVVEGEETACLAAFASASQSATQAGSSTKTVSITGTAETAGSQGGTEKKGLAGGAIAGIVVGVVLGLSALALILLCCVRRRNKRTGNTAGGFAQRHRKMPSASTSPSEGGHGSAAGHGLGLGGQAADKGPIALGALNNDGSYRSDAEKRGSVDSMGNTVDSSLAVPVTAFSSASKSNPNDKDSDPFGTPTLAEIRAVSPIYTGADDSFSASFERGSSPMSAAALFRRESEGQRSVTSPPTTASALLRQGSGRQAGITSPAPAMVARESPRQSIASAVGGLDFSATRSSLVGLGIGPSPVVQPRSASDSVTGGYRSPLSPVEGLAYEQPSPHSPSDSITEGIMRSPLGHGLSPPAFSFASQGTRRGSGSGSGSGSSGASTPPQISPNPGQTQHATSALTRNGSTRRKPVPSLGPELRTELARQASLKGLRGKAEADRTPGPSGQGQGQGGLKSFQLIPDPPLRQD